MAKAVEKWIQKHVGSAEKVVLNTETHHAQAAYRSVGLCHLIERLAVWGHVFPLKLLQYLDLAGAEIRPFISNLALAE
jgi:hypothetical protein